MLFLKGGFNLFKLFNDTFIINEIIDTSFGEILLENEFTLSDKSLDIETIISTEGKVQINKTSSKEDFVSVEGSLNLNIIYRSSGEDVQICSVQERIPFIEEINAPGTLAGMDVALNAAIDYIDVQPTGDKSFLVKALVTIDKNVSNNRPVQFISNIESDGSFQAKTKKIKYTEEVENISEEITISEALELNKSSDSIALILKSEQDVFINNIETLNNKLLVEGTCKVGFIYTENNDLNTTAYASDEFPFSHYIETKDNHDDLISDINVLIGEMTYDVLDADSERKVIEFKLPLKLNLTLYNNVEKNIIVDCYSTDSLLQVEAANVNLTSLKNIIKKTQKFENTFDVLSGTIKDIYTVDVSPKVSEKRIVDKKYVVDGFLDTNLLYLNGNINKIDLATSSIPFTVEVDLKEDDINNLLVSDIKINRCSVHRKNSTSAVLNCEINLSLKVQENEEITVISNVMEAGQIDRSKMPSLIFRVVQPGETIWDIAKNYNLSINYLKELNEIPDDGVLTQGNKIIIARSV